MVKLRMQRFGANKAPYYRIVATDSRNPRDGRFIEIIGLYHPTRKDEQFKVDEEKALPCDILKVDVDILPTIAGKYGIQMIPTLLLLKDGKILAGTRGYMAKPQLLDFVRKSLD